MNLLIDVSPWAGREDAEEETPPSSSMRTTLRWTRAAAAAATGWESSCSAPCLRHRPGCASTASRRTPPPTEEDVAVLQRRATQSECLADGRSGERGKRATPQRGGNRASHTRSLSLRRGSTNLGLKCVAYRGGGGVPEIVVLVFPHSLPPDPDSVCPTPDSF